MLILRQVPHKNGHQCAKVIIKGLTEWLTMWIACLCFQSMKIICAPSKISKMNFKMSVCCHYWVAAGVCINLNVFKNFIGIFPANFMWIKLKQSTKSVWEKFNQFIRWQFECACYAETEIKAVKWYLTWPIGADSQFIVLLLF